MTFETSSSNHEQTLNALWQQQERLDIDSSKVIKMAKSQRLKQRFYMFMDMLSLTPWLLFFVWDIQLSLFLKVFIVLNAIAGTVMIAYFIKLRWISAFGEHSSTEDYKTTLLQQLKNNARIAFINKHLAWISYLAASLIIFLHALFIEQGPFEFTKKILVLGMVAPLMLLPWWIWASKRQARFEREYKNLHVM